MVGVPKPRSSVELNATSSGTYPIQIDRVLMCICGAVTNSLAGYNDHLAQSEYQCYSVKCISDEFADSIFTYSSQSWFGLN